MTQTVDVTICGGGPVGLLLAYCLARYGISTFVVEKDDKAKHAMYGRAAMLAPRSLEMLEQLDLEQGLGQRGFVTRGQVSFRGAEKIDGITYASSNITDTFYDYLLLVRQMYIENTFRSNYEGFGKGSVHFGVKLNTYQIEQSVGDHQIRSVFQNEDGSTFDVWSRFLVGADGSRSTVRELAGIPFEGSKNNRHFIRIDGVVKTNMPDARKGLVSVDSKSHGAILWACLDGGRTRIGFAVPEKLYQDLGDNISQLDIITEAKKALEPWKLEFEIVDWWTAYSVGQRLAADFSAENKIFLAGDSGHTHSSTAAQGLNVGIHDAINLSWKLAGHIHGDFKDSVISSYAAERRVHAEHVINQDRMLSRLHSGELPDDLKDIPGIDRKEVMDRIYRSNQSLNIGIGLAYPCSNPTLVSFSGLRVSAGERAPDVLLQRPGIRVPLRLLTQFKNIGKFTVLAFCGIPSHNSNSLRQLRSYIDSRGSFTHRFADIFQYITIMKRDNEYGSTEENLSVPCFGRAFYDVDGSAHERYGVDTLKGMVVIVRPDGSIGTAFGLEEGAKASEYFHGFLNVKDRTPMQNGDDAPVGPIEGALGEVDMGNSAHKFVPGVNAAIE